MVFKKEFIAEGLNHGGRILAAAEKYAIPVEDWIDLSTGLNPDAWPVPAIPSSAWQALPEDNDGLQKLACDFYGSDACLPVAGSQVAIQLLPELRSYSKVGIVSPTYAEHEYNWNKAGHEVTVLSADEVDKVIDKLDVLVVVNPNNPTGRVIDVATLLNWHQQLSVKGGWLVVDEAFMDVTPGHSLVMSGRKPGLVILRSMGKFFGLAGIRCGFVIADDDLLQLIADKLGPWSLTGVTRFIAKKALADNEWHKTTRIALTTAAERLQRLLVQHELEVSGGTALFQWCTHSNAKEIADYFAAQGILLRYFDKTAMTGNIASLRFGLPADESQWQRFTDALVNMPASVKKQHEELSSYV